MPIGSGVLSVQVPAGILEDLAFNANTASNTISGAGNSAPVAVAGVAQVVASGAVVALDGSGSSDPDGTALSYNAPVWTRINANWNTDQGAQSQYVFAAIGGHSKLSNNLLVGGMLQVDHLAEVNGVATTEGNGWLVGPYFAAKLEGQPLYFEGSLLYGQTFNTVSPLGTYTDSFTSERWLATLGVSGAFERGKLALLPFLDAKYTSDSQAAYVDGLGNPIAAQTIGLAQVSAGLDLEIALNAATTLKAGASGTWSYSSGSAIAAGYEGGRARISLGVVHRFGACSGLELSSFYDGIGAADFESYGAELKWEVCF